MAAEGLGVVAKLASGKFKPLICILYIVVNVNHIQMNFKGFMLATGFVNTRVSIDNWSFKFYYKYTTSLLLLFSAGTTAR